MARPITVGLNGSDESLAAADWAAREACRRRLPLRLLYAWEWLPEPTPAPVAAELPQNWPDRMLDEAATQLESRYPDLDVTADQVENMPVHALVEAARESELLALGSRGLGTVHGFLTGSVSLAVVARSPRPVVLVRAADRTGPGVRREIVVGLDPVHRSDAVLEFAFEAAEAAGEDVPLRVVHAWDAPAPHRHAPGGPTPRQCAAMEKREREALQAVLRPWRERYPNVAVHEELAAGNAASHLVQAASTASLLVVGRGITRPAMGTHLGPVGHAVLHHAACPVAVVPHE